MRKKSGTTKPTVEQVVKDIRRKTRKHHSSEEKIRIVLEGLRGEESIAALCRREGIATSGYQIHDRAIGTTPLKAGPLKGLADAVNAGRVQSAPEIAGQLNAHHVPLLTKDSFARLVVLLTWPASLLWAAAKRRRLPMWFRL